MYKVLAMGCVCFLLFSSVDLQSSIDWKELEPGLQYASVPLQTKSFVGDSKVDVLKIDAQSFEFKLICAAEQKGPSKTADIWAKENKLIALVNAGMFKLEGDLKTCTGFMKNFKYVNNPTLNPSYKNVMVFNAKDSTVPKAQIVDISCQNWKTLQSQYQSFSQGIRMLNCEGKNTWQQDQKKWSMVLLGEDKDKNILFIFVRSPYRVYDFVNHLKGLDLNLKRLMYLEGGPEASLYVDHTKLKLQRMGSYETGFNENDNNREYWQIPNVIGIVRR